MNEEETGPPTVPTVARLVSEYLAVHRTKWTGNTYLAVKSELRRFVQFIGDRELTPKIIADYQAEQHARQCSPNSRHRSIVWPNQFLKWIEEMEYAKPNRFSTILVNPPRPTNKVKLFTHSEFEALKNAAIGTQWHYAVIMAYRAGTRYSDTALMKWENVDLDKLYLRYVPFKSRKTGREAICPFDAGGDLHQVLLELNECHHSHPLWTRYVCPEMAMTYPTVGAAHAPALRRHEFARLCKKVGVPPGHSFHSLRHSFISRLVNGGVALPIASQITGITSPQVFIRYAKPDLDTLRKSIRNANKGDEPPAEGTVIKLPGAA